MATDIEVIVSPAVASAQVTVNPAQIATSVIVATGAPGLAGTNGTNGSDATVTAANIASALGQGMTSSDAVTFTQVTAGNFRGSVGQTITFSDGPPSHGGSGGSILLNGGSGSDLNNDSNGGDAGSINLSGADYSALSSNGTAPNGGSINLMAGPSASGGSIYMAAGGGSINTTGTGTLELGSEDSSISTSTRTVLTGSATTHRDIAFPDASGTVVLDPPNDGLTYARKNGTWFVIGVPSNTVLPALYPSGETFTGIQLSVSNGSWTGSTLTYFYQWQKSSDSATWTNILGATSSTFTPDTSYATNYVRVAVIASNGFGPSSTVYSDATAELQLPAYPLGAIAAWHFNDDNNGNVSLVDSTGNGYDLINNNGVTLGNGAVVGGCAVFGAGQNFTFLTDAGLDFGTGAFSVSMWVKTSATQSSGSNIFGVNGDGGYANGCIATWLNASALASHKVRIIQYTNSDLASTSGSVPSDTWTNIAYVRASGVLSIFINGTLNNYGDFDAPMNFNLNGTAFIGGGDWDGSDGQYYGSLDEMVIWNRALSASEITQIASGIIYPA